MSHGHHDSGCLMAAKQRRALNQIHADLVVLDYVGG